jgi:pimeloyl-ACP methyl ester carboxylesterase
MPDIDVNDTRLYYEIHGDGRETIVFSHGLLMNAGMFSAQVQVLKQRYRCITYDHRGQGRSAVPDSGYDMDNVTRDAASLIRSLGAWPCHFVGLSMGGFVGMRLAIHHPELLSSLTLMETSADPEPRETVGPYRRMAFVGRWFGFGLVIGRVMDILFGKSFMSDPERERQRRKWRERILQNNRRGIYHAAHGVIDREGVYEQLEDIETPTLIIVGEEDTATTPGKAQRMHEKIAGSKLVVIPQAGHSSSIEQPDAVNREIVTFLSGLS